MARYCLYLLIAMACFSPALHAQNNDEENDEEQMNNCGDVFSNSLRRAYEEAAPYFKTVILRRRGPQGEQKVLIVGESTLFTGPKALRTVTRLIKGFENRALGISPKWIRYFRQEKPPLTNPMNVAALTPAEPFMGGPQKNPRNFPLLPDTSLFWRMDSRTQINLMQTNIQKILNENPQVQWLLVIVRKSQVALLNSLMKNSDFGEILHP